MEKRKILVLMGVFNGAGWIDEQLASISAQRNVDVSLLVGDDCSSDHSVDMVRKFNFNHPLKISSYTKSSGGAGANFLRLLTEADVEDFDYVAFSDQDDVWHEDKLFRAVAAIESSGADAYSCAVEAFWPDGKTKILAQNASITDIDFLFEGAGQGCTFVMRSLFVRKIQDILNSGDVRLEGIHYHDWLVYALARTLSMQWFFDQKPCLRYRQHSGNDTGARGAWPAVAKRLSLISDGWYAVQVKKILCVVEAVGGHGCLPDDFYSAFNSPPSLKRRVALASILLSRGRRRMSDRVVLAVSSLLGWI